ncbi:MAG: acyl-CoA dehydratase activase [Desulfobulbaceae bacterium]|nr:acyl-CoA dehydratase activase [Desulfobulbaceae bacterium]
MPEMESIGICLGASTIGRVRLRRHRGVVKIIHSESRPHDGNPRLILERMLEKEPDCNRVRLGATGRKFKELLAVPSITEPEALELAIAHILPEDHPYRIVISAGGETTMIYHLDREGRVQDILTGNKCASGTGEFFLQQLNRMSITLDEVNGMEFSDSFHKVSGRCSVFCKSDCTHALNKGVSKAGVVAGLSRMMAGKILELLKKLPPEPVMLVGGCARNRAMVHYLHQEIADLHIPAEAACFEALGAGLWALHNNESAHADLHTLFREHHTQLSHLRPLSEYASMVEFKKGVRRGARPGDETILGLDVGSTTTKGVVMRRRDKAILAADYLRTNGDPVHAARRVYRSLARQLTVPIAVKGLGVTGSGRQIAGLHAMTDGVINEIIAHATGALYFDSAVDTIFEIGGQDAKYTFITNGVPCDYAMNEACSAGTGSFLEESAWETLGLDVTSIGETALKGVSPPNFNDQCAAFISSDIKRAVQENFGQSDIVAGLVYSICMNYTNRVKGNRPVGEKVFMQGGVCYNRAVPAAMAALTGKRIVVPPDPGLVGAFGVALEVDRRLEKGLLAPADFNLRELMDRTVAYEKPFRCSGGRECDRGCEIARIRINDRVYPFGGICNRYDNILHKRRIKSTGYDLVIRRELRVFRDLAPDDPADTRPTVGMNRSLLVNSYFPFFNRFFAELGFRLVLPAEIDLRGMDRQGAAFCHPVELAHAYAANLVRLGPDFYFLPLLRSIPVVGAPKDHSSTCVFVQGEPFYLRTAFPELEGEKSLTPTLYLADGIMANLPAFREIASNLGVDPEGVVSALNAAAAAQENFYKDIREMGREALGELRKDPDTFGVVLFGRPYNSFASVANKGIPAKFATRGFRIIPVDMLPADDAADEVVPNMYWAMGRVIMSGARWIKDDPQLFGTYITNFSCGPDSFIVSYFRDLMGRKPSLTLELDSHTADAGLETRIEAFLDIVRSFRQLQPERKRQAKTFIPARMENQGDRPGIRTSDGGWLPLTDKRVKILLPAMSRYGTRLLARSFSRVGVRAETLPPADEQALKLGRGNSSCKECLPLQTTIGALLQYLRNRPEDEVVAYYMPSAQGPCRFGQYNIFSSRVIARHQFRDVAVMAPTSGNGYNRLGDRFLRAAWQGIIIGDLFDEMWATVLAAAEDREAGLALLDREYLNILEVMHRGWPTVAARLSSSAKALAGLRLKRPYHEIPKISLVGEIYVRHDPISLQRLIERLADRGFAVRTAPNGEWIKYLDWLVKNRIEGRYDMGFRIRNAVKSYLDRRIRKRLQPSGLFFFDGHAGVEPVTEAGRRFISPHFTCEVILTVGAALHEILHPACGVISIGPFGCMPSRVAEAVLNEKFTTTVKREIERHNGGALPADIVSRERKLPFMAIETDGNLFPQLIEARLEAFCLQARRINEIMLAAR